MADSTDITDLARTVLDTADPHEKAARAHTVARLWRDGSCNVPDTAQPVANRPARPDSPELVAPGDVPRRRLNGPAGRTALLHAVAHIELNAIDLAFDLVARFATDTAIADDRRRNFISDWITVGDDEARHFNLLSDRLSELGAAYGDMPAHDGLWDAATATRGSLPARLAVAPMVLEARGLDVTPGMIDRLVSAGDKASADCLRIIYTEEVAHVAAGVRWFRHVAERAGKDPENWFKALVRQHYGGSLKPPFNVEARASAELFPEFYQTLT
ncbi:ferritin-like domain-containing protein [Maricaulis sp.]|uniref:ferritin-like domain-containing protein n=1 Tax=Maricaulis sp. TaxID=1486257 RepID=UPI002B26CCD2|nr:ferritin-like domain-containing protein [Maricaulis sp.]